tara:strand:+ start:38 stop:652 length:615 start_codon:yes stop_codon:yes gene_type:complete
MSTQKQKIAFSDSKLKRFENALNEQSKERKAELRRSIEIKVDSQIEKKFNSFLKELKIDKILKKHAQAEKEFNDFERSYELKRRKLKEDVEQTSSKICDIFDVHSKINDWNSYCGSSDNNYEHTQTLKRVCKDEIRKQLIKDTKEGQELSNIDNQVKNYVLMLSYPNLEGRAIDIDDINQALNKGQNLLGFILNKPNNVKQISN